MRKNFFFKNYTLGYDINKVIYQGYGTAVKNPTLLNVYVERRFLKNNKGTLRIQGFDLFDQNTGITRTINGTTTTDSRSDRLGRYFLLTFNLRLQKFAGRQPNRMPGDRMNPGERMNMPGGGQRGPGGPGGGQRNSGGGGNRRGQ